MSKHFTTNSTRVEREGAEMLRRKAERLAREEQAELLRRVQSIKANLDRKAGR